MLNVSSDPIPAANVNWEDIDPLAVCADALNTATLAILSKCPEAERAESPATYSVLIAPAADELKLLLAVVANPLIASLWVWADELKAVSPATYSVLKAADLEEDKLLLAVVANPLIASLCVWAELLRAVSPATYSVLRAPAAEELKLLLAVVARPLIASLCVWAEADSPDVPPPASNDSILVFNAPLKAVSPALYSVLKAPAAELLKELLAVVARPLIASLWVWAELLNAVSPATYSVLNADALELENAVCVEVANLLPIDVAILAEKLGSSFKAAANSSNVSRVAGAELTIPATLASI